MPDMPPIDPNTGMPYDPATLQQLQQQEMMRYIAQGGGGAATRLNEQAAGLGISNLFPSQAVQTARQVQTAMAQAQAGIDPQGNGESDLDFSIRQLRAQRDAVASVSPESAAAMNTQLLKLGEMRFQQSRLAAQDQRSAEQESDLHAERQADLPVRQLQGQNAAAQAGTGIPAYLGPQSGLSNFDLSKFRMYDLSDPDQREQYLAARQQPGMVPLSADGYSAVATKLAELKQRADDTADAKARYGAGALGSFGDPKVEALLASMASKGVQMPTGFRSKDQMLATFRGLLTKYDGLNTDDIADLVGKGIIDYKAVGKATQTGATILGRVTAASGELDAMVPIARDASAAVNRSDFVPYNKLQQMVLAGTSSPEQKRLYVATQSILNTYDLLASRGGTDAAKREAQHKMLETADGPQAYNAALDMLVKESQVARAGALGAIRSGTYGTDEQRAAQAAGAQPQGNGQGAAQPPAGSQPGQGQRPPLSSILGSG
jgi:hypothetical protein